MEWKDVAAAAGRFAPVVGTLLGNPLAGALVGSMVSAALGTKDDPAEVATALATNPDAAVKLKEFEVRRQVELEALATRLEEKRIDAEQANMAQVNETIRVEGRSEHWVQYSWRPMIGFSVAFAVASMALAVVAAYTAVVLKGEAKGIEHLPAILGAMSLVVGVASPILGIASYFRGRMQAAFSPSTK